VTGEEGEERERITDDEASKYESIRKLRSNCLLTVPRKPTKGGEKKKREEEEEGRKRGERITDDGDDESGGWISIQQLRSNRLLTMLRKLMKENKTP
jgi:hypothetical protein